MALRELLASPAIAVVLGFLVGLGLIAATAWGRRFASEALDSIIVMMSFMVGGMLVASAILIGYALYARDGFLYFGLSLAAGFVLGLAFYGLKMWRHTFRD